MTKIVANSKIWVAKMNLGTDESFKFCQEIINNNEKCSKVAKTNVGS